MSTEKIRIAKTEHDCYTPGCVIHPGDRYLDTVIFPWEMVQEDPDYPPSPVGEWMRWRAHVDGHNEDGMIDLFHRTTFAAKVEITAARRFKPLEKGQVYFSNRREGQAEGYGNEIVRIRIPRTWAKLDDEFPDGEKHYRVDVVRASNHIVEEW